MTVPPLQDFTGGEWIRAVGIDPGGEAGLVAVLVPPSLDVARGRFIGCASINTGTSVHESKPQIRARMFHRIRDLLLAWQPSVVVLEEPWDAMPAWGAGRRTKGASRGTIFSLGSHFGLALAAASDLGAYVRIASYPVTSARAKERETVRGTRTTPERIGWMQRRNPKPPSRDRVLSHYRAMLREIKAFPVNGVLPSTDELDRVEAEDVYMSLGVLDFHFDRERGRV